MIEISTAFILLALLCIPISWLLPRDRALEGVSLWTLLGLSVLAPVAAGWLLLTSIAVPLFLSLGERTGMRNFLALLAVILVLAGLIASRTLPGPVWVGIAFFTLRHLHVIGEWWMQRLAAPSLRSYLRYQLFLPVIVVGPINRIEHFERQLARRRWDAGEFLEGAERVLVGAFMAAVLGSWIAARIALEVDIATGTASPFLQDWAASAMDWIVLYFQFAGFSAVALGTALMMGLRLEENFNRPWNSKNLLEFWTRWHMTLARWVMDYVFRPVMAITRNAFFGLVAAMLAIGLWHEFSAYYVLWSFWQVLGIVLTRWGNKLVNGDTFPRLLRETVPPLIVLAWLSLSRPVVERVLELIG